MTTKHSKSVVRKDVLVRVRPGVPLLSTAPREPRGEVSLDVKALTFDVFGTVGDWRGGVAREVAADFPELAERPGC